MTSYGSQPGATPPGPGQEPTPQGPPPGYVPPPGGPSQGYVPPQGGPPPGMPPAAVAPPPRRRSPLMIIGIIVLALVLICGVGGVLLFTTVMNATQPIANAGDAYMAALRDGDYNKAFELSSASLKQVAGDAEGLKTALGSKQVSSWSFTGRSIDNGQGALSGTTTYTDGTTGTVDMALTQEGNDWRVSGINLK